MKLSSLKPTKINLPLILVITFALWVATTVSKVLFNGLVLGLDYGLYHPDGAFYTFRALLFAGFDKFEAGKVVADWYATNPAKPGNLDPTSLFYENAPNTWDQYYPRILYPLLSSLFVKFFGVPGMLVVPSITYLIVLLTVAFIAFKINRVGIGLLVIILITSSTTISRWMYINATDGLLMLFTALFILLIFSKSSLKLSNLEIILTLVLILLSSLTRFSALMWVAIAIIFLFNKQIKTGLIIAVTALLSAIPIFLRPFGNDVLPELNERSPIEKVFYYPWSLIRISVYELGQLFVLDRIFFWTLLFGLLFAFLNLKRLESQFFLSSFISLWITGSLNAVLGVNFRYQLAVVPFLLWLLLALLPSFKWTHSKNLSGISEEVT